MPGFEGLARLPLAMLAMAALLLVGPSARAAESAPADAASADAASAAKAPAPAKKKKPLVFDEEVVNGRGTADAAIVLVRSREAGSAADAAGGDRLQDALQRSKK